VRLEKSHKVEVSNGDEVMLKQSTGIVIVVLRSEKKDVIFRSLVVKLIFLLHDE
jgi:hypothetical protein